MVLKCGSYKRYTTGIGRPPTELTSICVAWPFVQWGIDLVGFLLGSTKHTYIIVVIDYFSRWIEVKCVGINHRIPSDKN